MQGWEIYTGSGSQHDGVEALPAPPPWRTFTGSPPLAVPEDGTGNRHAALTYLPGESAVSQVNAALYLRRPLLVTGLPGVGKSTLARAVAHELKLGPVLHWPITSKSTLREGLYEYDPLGRLYAASRGDDRRTPSAARPPWEASGDDDIGNFIRLGPLGTALLPYDRPRVLLIDEIDKSDIDLPNDLLTIFETGSYPIMELARRPEPSARVMTADSTEHRVEISHGAVTCRQFPLVIMTSNGEREFPPAFLRRCLALTLRQPSSEAALSAIVGAHLTGVVGSDGELPESARIIIKHFFDRRNRGLLANDQLLNAIYLCHHALVEGPPETVLALADQIMPYLGELGADNDN